MGSICEQAEHDRDQTNLEENKRKIEQPNCTGLRDLCYTVKKIEYCLREPNINIYHIFADF